MIQWMMALDCPSTLEKPQGINNRVADTHEILVYICVCVCVCVFFLCLDISTFRIRRDNNIPTKEEIKLHESFQIKLDLTKSEEKDFFLKFQQQPKSILKYGICSYNSISAKSSATKL